MKIAILQGAFLPVPPTSGGAVEKMWFALGKDFAKKGNEVVHISRSCAKMPDEEWIEGVLHKRVRGYDTPSSMLRMKWLDLLYTWRARSVIPADADVVVTNTFWAPVILPGHLKRKCVPDVARMPKGQMWLYKQAPRLRANSSPVADAIRNELLASQHQRVIMIPNPLPFQYFPVTNDDEKKPVLLYTGRIHPEKGLELLINAFKKISNGWTLNIIGPAAISAGGGGADYLNRLKLLAEDAAINFMDPIFDSDKLNQFYREASIFIYPSVAEKGETFGLAPLEAMAWGCVPVVSDLSCFRDFIVPEKNGLVFDHRATNAVDLLGKAITRLQDDKPLRVRLASKALEVRETHSTSFIAAKFLEEFESIITHPAVYNYTVL